jgi:hypothetical protein
MYCSHNNWTQLTTYIRDSYEQITRKPSIFTNVIIHAQVHAEVEVSDTGLMGIRIMSKSTNTRTVINLWL